MRYLSLAFFLVTCVLCQAQSPFHRVRSGLDSEDTEPAKRILDSCSFKNYCQDSILFYKGLLTLKKGNLKNARTLSNTLHSSYPAFTEVHYLSAMIYFVDKNYGSSIEEFGKILKSDPRHLKALYNRSLAFGMLEDYKAAIEDLNMCISIRSDQGPLYYSRAYWCEFAGKHAEAQKDYEKSIQLDPKNYDAYFGLAFIYQNQKDNSKACETIGRAIHAGSQIAEELKENYCK